MKKVNEKCHLLDRGGDAEVPNARCGELPGVQVGDVLHDLLKALNVITLKGQRGLVGVKLHLYMYMTEGQREKRKRKRQTDRERERTLISQHQQGGEIQIKPLSIQ